MESIFERAIFIGTNAERVAMFIDREGAIFFETDTGDAYWYDGAAWVAMGGGGGGHTIQDEGIDLTQRTNLNFVGAGVEATDDAPNDATVITIPAPTVNNVKEIVFKMEGTLIMATGGLRLYNTLGADFDIEEVEIAVSTAPTGNPIIVDIHKNGVTIFTNQAHRPSIAIGAFQATTLLIDVPDWDDGDYLTMDIDAIGTTIAGANLTCMIRAVAV